MSEGTKGGAPPSSWLIVTRLEGYKQSISKALGEQLEGGVAVNPDGHMLVHGERVFEEAGRQDLANRLRDMADALETMAVTGGEPDA